MAQQHLVDPLTGSGRQGRECRKVLSFQLSCTLTEAVLDEEDLAAKPITPFADE